MTNLEQLVEAGAVTDTGQISEEHKRILNEDFTAEEINAIIKLKDKITGIPFASDPSAGGDDSSGMAAL